MATNPPVQGNREDLDKFVSQTKQSQSYTKGVKAMNSLLLQNNVPIPSAFQTVVQHSITMVENGQMSNTTAHLREVTPLVSAAVDHAKSGNYKNAAICIGGATGNILAAVVTGGKEKSEMNIGKKVVN
jgi:hypothetical protein